MVIKINYTSSDIYVSTNVSPVYVVVNYSAVNNGAGGAIWGGITGTLSDQTDLQNALNAKVPYSGATAAVNLGAYDLTVNELTIGKGLNGVANNTALGKRTLFHNTTGNYNTAVGHEAGHNITTGQYNTAIGQSAMFTATTAGQNTAVGVNALLLATSGGTNVAVGLDTLQHITTGSSNTAIGYNAGSHITGGATPNTTATNSVFIGRDSKAAADGQTNQIVIGQNAVGNGSNTATFGNTATTANYFTGSINGGSFVKSGGTSSQFLKADGSVDSSTYVGGSGATGQVAYWNGTNSQTGSNNLFWDAANARLGIGTNASLLYPVTIYNATNAFLNFNVNSGSSRYGGFRFQVDGFDRFTIAYRGEEGNLVYSRFNSSGAYQGDNLTIFNATGNVVLTGSGSATDGGQRLQVYGDAFIKGSGATSATNALLVQNSAGTQLAQFRNDQYISIGNTASTIQLGSFINFGAVQLYPINNGNYAVSATATELRFDTTFSGATTGDFGYQFGTFSAHNTSNANPKSVVVSATFSPTSGTQTFTNLLSIPTINQTGGANGITRGLYVNPTLTAAADWRSIEWSNNSGWGLYGAGTAQNLLSGVTTIRTNASSNEVPLLVQNYQTLSGFKTVSIDLVAVNGDARITAGNQNTGNGANGFLTFSTRTAEALTEKVRIDSAGKLLIGTTSADANSLVNINGAVRCVSDFRSFVNGSESTYQGGFYQQTTSGTTYAFTQQLGSTGQIRWWTYNPTNLFVNHMTLTNAGRLLLGLTAESTFLLDVNGTARVSGNATFSSDVSLTGSGSQGLLTISNTYSTLRLVGSGSVGQFNIQKGFGYSLIESLNEEIRYSATTHLFGGTTNVTSALVNIDSTTKGFLPPRMTTTQKNAITTPAAGLVVYDTDTNKLCCYNGTSWNDLF